VRYTVEVSSERPGRLPRSQRGNVGLMKSFHDSVLGPAGKRPLLGHRLDITPLSVRLEPIDFMRP